MMASENTITSSSNGIVASNATPVENTSLEEKVIFGNLEENDPAEAYILHRGADDPTGHKARQVFRTDAASKRGKESIFFYMKDAMKSHGTAKKKSTFKTMTETNFKAFIASIPALDAYLTDEEVVALYYKMDQRRRGILDLEDLVHFALLDKNQIHALLIKYWISLKRKRLSDLELRETFSRLVKEKTKNSANSAKSPTASGSASSKMDNPLIDPDMLHSLIAREFDVSLTSGELKLLIYMMDTDRDGSVSLNDFTTFVNQPYETLVALLTNEDQPIIDINISLTEAEETEFRRAGYAQLAQDIYANAGGTKPAYMWYKRAVKPRDDAKPAVTKLKLASNSRDTTLIANGFQCLVKDINRAGSLGKSQYLWMSYSSSLQESLQDGVIDMAITTGNEKDDNDAMLWMPPCRRFLRIDGDLNEKSSKSTSFLWVRTRNELLLSSLITTPRPNLNENLVKSPNVMTKKKSFFRTMSKMKMSSSDTSPTVTTASTNPEGKILSPNASRKNVETLYTSVAHLESKVRQSLRRKCPVDRSGCLDLERLFNEFDSKKHGYLSMGVFKTALDSFGMMLEKKDFALFWKHLDAEKKGKLKLPTFLSILSLNDSGIDEVASHIQRHLSDAMKQGHDYRSRFREFNSSGDGKLSRTDFQRMLSSVQIRVTAAEMTKLIARFDMNEDGVVDYVDFLRFITGVCDDFTRQAKRVADAAEEIYAWALENQNKKLAKEGNIDSTAAWKLLKPRDSQIPIANIDNLLRQRKIRLTRRELTQVSVLMSPKLNGKIIQNAFHSFVNHKPKKLSTLMSTLKVILGNEDDKDDDNSDIIQHLDIGQKGTIDLVSLHKQLKVLASEVGTEKVDIKDLVYAVQHTGSDIAGENRIVIDRFVHGVQGNSDRRNMKYDFVTTSDSLGFIEGVAALRTEIHRTAKTPDGKYDYRLPYNIFDSDQSGSILLSEFEKMLKDLDIEKYMNEAEIKTLMRRFDVDKNTGGIGFQEFRRFASEPVPHPIESSFSSKTTGGSGASESDDVDRIFQQLHHDILVAGKQKAEDIESKFEKAAESRSGDNGLLPTEEFMNVLHEILGTQRRLPTPDQKRIVSFLTVDHEGMLDYRDFVRQLSMRGSYAGDASSNLDRLNHTLGELHEDAVHAESRFNFDSAFKGIDTHKSGKVPTEKFLDVIRSAGVGVQFSDSTLKWVVTAFQGTPTEKVVDYGLFLDFVSYGPEILKKKLEQAPRKSSVDASNSRISEASYGSTVTPRGQIDATLAQLQVELQAMAKKAGGQSPNFSQVFSTFDANGDGFISVSEFLKVLHKLGLAKEIIDKNEHSALVDFFDTDRDGRINYQEFCSFAKNAHQRIMDDLTGVVTLLPDQTKYESKTTASPAMIVPVSTKREVSDTLNTISRLNARIKFKFRKEFQKQREKTSRAIRSEEGLLFEMDFKVVLNRFKKRAAGRALNSKQILQLTNYYRDENSAEGYVNFQNFCEALDQLRKKATVVEDPTSSDASMSPVDDSSDSSDDDSFEDDTSHDISQLLKSIVEAACPTNKKVEKLVKRVRNAAEDDEEEGISSLSLADFRDRLKHVYRIHLSKYERQDVEKCFAVSRRASSQKKIKIRSFNKAILKAAQPNSDVRNLPIDRLMASLSMSDSSLLSRIFDCLVSAAQRNISWLKCIETSYNIEDSVDGTISLEEFQMSLQLLGCPVSRQEVRQIRTILANSGQKSNYRRASSGIDYKRFYEILSQFGTSQSVSQPPQQPIYYSQPPPPQQRLQYYNNMQHQSKTPRMAIPQQVPYVPEVASFPTSRSARGLDTSRMNEKELQAYLQNQLRSMNSRYKTDLIQVFSNQDRESNGVLNIPTFMHTLTREMGGVMVTPDVEAYIIHRFAADSYRGGNRGVQYRPFCAFVSEEAVDKRVSAIRLQELQGSISERLNQLRRQGVEVTKEFDAFDNRRVGEIRVREFREVCRKLGLPLTDEELDSIIQGFPASPSTVAYKDFLKFANINETAAPPPQRDEKAEVWTLNTNRSREPSARYSARSAKKSSREAREDAWSCKVCFHSQDATRHKCEICGASNPSIDKSATIVQQCIICAFENEKTSLNCSMCGTRLSGQKNSARRFESERVSW